MPQNQAGMIIATYEGIKVDWPVLIADGLCAAIDTVRGKDGKEGRKIWHAVTQWLTLLVPPVEAVQTKKRTRTADGSTPKTTSKRQQLLASKATKGKKRLTETQEETPVRPVKITIRRPGQKETDPLTAKINAGTQEEETEEEPTQHLQRRSRTKTVETARERSDQQMEGTPSPQPEPTTREEPEPARVEPVLQAPAQQVIPAGPETARPETQEPVRAYQEEAERERPANTQSGQGVEPDRQLEAIRPDHPTTNEPIRQAQQQQCTGSMWLRWIGEQIAGAVGYIEAEERAHNERLLVTTEELETARSKIRCLEKDLDRVTTDMHWPKWP